MPNSPAYPGLAGWQPSLPVYLKDELSCLCLQTVRERRWHRGSCRVLNVQTSVRLLCPAPRVSVPRLRPPRAARPRRSLGRRPKMGAFVVLFFLPLSPQNCRICVNAHASCGREEEGAVGRASFPLHRVKRGRFSIKRVAGNFSCRSFSCPAYGEILAWQRSSPWCWGGRKNRC